MAEDIGLTPRADDPSDQAWEQAVAASSQGDWSRALERLDTADKIFPGLWDPQRLREWLMDSQRVSATVHAG